MLSTLIYQNKYNIPLLVIIATIGNVLGSLVNYYLGFLFLKFKDQKWLPFKDDDIKNASKFYTKYGIWSLLFAWVPFIGDPLTIIAGIFRANIYKFVILVTIGKAGRYILLAIAVSQITAK